MPFRIEYSYDARDHLRALSAAQRKTIFDAVDDQLKHQPGEETRNRKPLRPNPIAPWELRIGDLRVFYDIVEEAELVVVLAVGEKQHDRLRIGNEELQL